MKRSLLRRFIDWTTRNESIFKTFWLPMSRYCSFIERQRFLHNLGIEESELHAACREIESCLEVRDGIFRGMRYCSAESAGSVFYPKLAGSYEQELEAVMKDAIERRPEVVVDVGCAEGYYAVGLARLLPRAIVHAYDTDSRARELCTSMAEINMVSDQLLVEGHCSQTSLRQFKQRRALIISDCEGYEMTLFSKKLIGELDTCDFLIECHDFLNPGTVSCLQSRFNPTHDVRLCTSVPDSVRPNVYANQTVAPYSHGVQVYLLAEHRPAQMHWLWCRSLR